MQARVSACEPAVPDPQVGRHLLSFLLLVVVDVVIIVVVVLVVT